MSFTDRLVLWLHIAFAIFTIGPLALAISSTPRYIRRREVPILRYLSRITVIFTAACLLVLVFGIILGQIHHDFSRPWLTVSMTLFVVAIVLLVLVIRDQRRAIKAVVTELPSAAAATGSGDGAASAADTAAGGAPAGASGSEIPASASGAGTAGGADGQSAAGASSIAAHVASVERGRIAALGGIVNLIWLAILVLMVWQP
jgi:type IV secretory pathway TrbL component